MCTFMLQDNFCRGHTKFLIPSKEYRTVGIAYVIVLIIKVQSGSYIFFGHILQSYYTFHDIPEIT